MLAVSLRVVVNLSLPAALWTRAVRQTQRCETDTSRRIGRRRAHPSGPRRRVAPRSQMANKLGAVWHFIAACRAGRGGHLSAVDAEAARQVPAVPARCLSRRQTAVCLAPRAAPGGGVRRVGSAAVDEAARGGVTVVCGPSGGRQVGLVSAGSVAACDASRERGGSDFVPSCC